MTSYNTLIEKNILLGWFWKAYNYFVVGLITDCIVPTPMKMHKSEKTFSKAIKCFPSRSIKIPSTDKYNF